MRGIGVIFLLGEEIKQVVEAPLVILWEEKDDSDSSIYCFESKSEEREVALSTWL